MLYLFGIICGIGVGMNAPTIFAWTIDLASPGNRGKALSTTFIGLEAGIGLGALLSSLLFQNNPERFGITFSIIAGIAGLALIYAGMIRNTSNTS
jgi:MFS family permease